ncbi:MULTISPECIES: hypothetical protein [Halomonas]|uniref:Uncharacterized protein n=1 Tax=Halomonas alimentaria TaxID=147248 RepID=A0A7X5ARP7_9GAMM|nr:MULTISPECIES: hypothetical protein [Halomonas]NAW35316.1 hypothetical protein [Halomonas alimentaria]
MLGQLPEGFTALITGAGGSIVAAVVDALLVRPGRVIGVGRYAESDSFYDWAGEPVAW